MLPSVGAHSPAIIRSNELCGQQQEVRRQVYTMHAFSDLATSTRANNQ